MHITVDRCVLIWFFLALVLHESFRLAGYVFVESAERWVKIRTEQEERKARYEREFSLGVESGQRTVVT